MDKSDLLQGTLDMLILKVVALGPIHGYGIALRIQQISKDALSTGQLPEANCGIQARRLVLPDIPRLTIPFQNR